MKANKYFSAALFLVLASCSNSKAPSVLNTSGDESSIIGGSPATAEDAITSSTVSLVFNYQGVPFSLCTGTLISKNMVLTATHCVEHIGEGVMSAYLGEKLPATFDESQMIKVAKWETHPDYEMILDEDEYPVTGKNDVALIRLEREVPTSSAPVPILDDVEPLKAGQTLLLAGYGLTNEIDTPVYADGLNYARVPLAKIWENILVTDQTNAQGACNGDSGGPAYLETSKGLIVVGITRGPHDKAKDCRHYGEYTYASKFKSFILEATARLQGEAPKFVTAP